MAGIVEDYMDSSENNDDLFPCKGCGEILEEGKAFELAGNRWHLDCFRCNTCSTLLDSDANLLLLGDGSLICNNCTYSCTACGNKIEDLAILTGDQAFCSTCFRCRNCKRKIENLRYARTSQGIFCMQCHETLMARRRKKSKAAAAAKAREKEQSMVDKSLPALPPPLGGGGGGGGGSTPNSSSHNFSNDRVVAPDTDTPTELSPRPRQAQTTPELTRRVQSPDAKPEGLGIPSQAYRKNRNSAIIETNSHGDADTFLIPVALDPSPGPSNGTSRGSDSKEDFSKKNDYFSVARTGSSSATEKRNDSAVSTPHIAFQEKRTYSADHEARSSLRSSASKSKQADLSKSASSPAAVDGRTPQPQEPARDSKGRTSDSRPKASSPDRSSTGGLPSPRTADAFGTLTPVQKRESGDVRVKEEEAKRESPDVVKTVPKPIQRKELPATAARNVNGQPPHIAAASSRISGSEQGTGSSTEAFAQPRTAPPPPPITIPADQRDGNLQPETSPKLPRWSSGGDFSMDDDLARILGTEERSALQRLPMSAKHARTGSVEASGLSSLPRSSHARSASEATRGTRESAQWPKSPELDGASAAVPAADLGSPMSAASGSGGGDDAVLLKRQLRNSEQRVAELERQFNSDKDLKTINKRLIEKRKTVVVLDSQTEILLKQLEVLTKYVEKAKETKSAVDPKELEDSVIRDFVVQLEKVKMAMSASIEKLHEEREQIQEEKEKAAADRDRALMEFEQLSMKNAQLVDMNNDLAQQLQGRYKSAGDKSNGLGIYQEHGRDGASLDPSSISSGAATLVADEEPIVEQGPTVVQVRKGQVKKFNWKKGSKTVAQNISKGMNKAVVAFQNERDRPATAGAAIGSDIGMPYNTTVSAVESPATPISHPARVQTDHGRQGFGFFGKKNAPASMIKSASGAMTPDVPEPPNVLFGSDLAARADFEKRQIPSIVTRCIEEVELRGMDQEGIYRKTGGNTLITQIKEGLDKDENFDLSEPDMDITAITSVLKQYFRKLPDPLLTFDVYERVLESTAIAENAERCEHLRKTFSALPQRHRDCLEFLMFHLDRVAKRESENLMSPKNLAVVFAPTIMRDLSIEREMTDMHAKNLAIQFVIENTHTIFES